MMATNALTGPFSKAQALRAAVMGASCHLASPC